LAGIRLATGDVAGAQEAVDEAMRRQPFNVRAWELELSLASEAGDEARFHQAAEVLCTLGVDGACGARLDG
jgi:cytochrome c-type biogenesis protein CcmH/NrfG